MREAAPHHAEYWSCADSSHRGGPFSDRSGGLIIFEAAEKTAERTIADDPFQTAALLEHWWLKAWEPMVG